MNDREIIFVAANPSIDRFYEVDRLTPGEIHRPRRVVAVAGGKGLNAARSAATLGATVSAATLLGGHAGDWIEQEFARLGIPLRAVRTREETRTCVSVADVSDAGMTEFYESGAAPEPDAWASFMSMVTELAGRPELGAVAISGSLPPGVPPDSHARLVGAFRDRSIATLVDTHGESLRHFLDGGASFIKINRAEAGELTGHAVIGVAAAAAAATSIRRRARAGHVIVTLGAAGAVLAGEDGAFHATGPAGSAGRYAVGSGDAFLGGLAAGLVRGVPVSTAVRIATAAAIANTLTPGAGELDASLARRMVDEVRIAPL
jgi:1-phosphofructokinase family hexose kinase